MFPLVELGKMFPLVEYNSFILRVNPFVFQKTFKKLLCDGTKLPIVNSKACCLVLLNLNFA